MKDLVLLTTGERVAIGAECHRVDEALTLGRNWPRNGQAGLIGHENRVQRCAAMEPVGRWGCLREGTVTYI